MSFDDASYDVRICPRCRTGKMFETQDMGSDDEWLECSICGYRSGDEE